MSAGLNNELHKQMKIVERFSAILGQVQQFLSTEVSLLSYVSHIKLTGHRVGSISHSPWRNSLTFYNGDIVRWGQTGDECPGNMLMCQC